MPSPLFVWAERMAPKLKAKHWAAVADAALYGIPYICSDFEDGEARGRAIEAAQRQTEGPTQ